MIMSSRGGTQMYIFKNAIKNLFRNKGRNIMIAIIMLSMLSFTAISMIINTTTDNVIKNYKEQFGSEIFLRYDETKIAEEQKNGNWVDIPEISDDVKIALADSTYLKETMIHILYPSYAKELKGLDQGKKESGEGDTIGIVPSSNETYYEANVVIHGYNTPELMKDFKEGKRTITSGKMFEKNDECVISEDFAKLNNLKIGDQIKIRDCNMEAEFAPLVLTITGIYYDSIENKFGYISAATNPRNDIITTYETMKNYQRDVANTKLYTVDTTYYLKNPDMLSAFNEEAHEKGLHKNYMMSTDELSYNRIVKPAESLAGVSNIFLCAVLLVGSMILILLSMLSIRERKYEIGVLRAIGMRKQKVVRGILYESLLTMSMCLVIGLTIGAAIAQPVSNMMIQNQQQQDYKSFGGAMIEQEEIVVSLTPKAILDVSIIALLLVVLSTSVGVMYIVRYEPMKILSERN